MRYFKIIDSGYIVSIGRGTAGEKITKSEYDAIAETLAGKPVAPSGYGYKLNTDLAWELHEIPPVEVEEDPELSAEEALDIIANGGADNA